MNDDEKYIIFFLPIIYSSFSFLFSLFFLILKEVSDLYYYILYYFISLPLYLSLFIFM